MQPDGNTIKIRIATDCDHIKEYADILTEVTLTDAMTKKDSRISESDIKLGLTPSCMVPNAVYYACWMEAGMLSKHLAQDMAESNSVDFVKDKCEISKL